MPPVFGHGRLRLYLLKLLDEAPRHGYEVIRLLEERFQGRYAPSAGTVYPRLAKLEAEGLVTHATEGGRKVYSLTRAGRDELRDRRHELTQLEREIRASLAELAAGLRQNLSESAEELRREMRSAARHGGGTDKRTDRPSPSDPEPGSAEDWREQARRAREESRRAQQEAREAREQARRAREEVQEEVQRIARRIQVAAQSRLLVGDWQGALRATMTELGREVSTLSRFTGDGAAPSCPGADGPAAGREAASDGGRHTASGWTPEWSEDPAEPVADPARELERLLDRCRDDVRDAARDFGVSQEQLRQARRRLSETAAHLVAMLRSPDSGSDSGSDDGSDSGSDLGSDSGSHGGEAGGSASPSATTGR